MKKMITAALALLMWAATATGCRDDARSWAESRAWAPEGFALALHESVDAERFRDQYTRNRELWDAVFVWLRDTRLDTLPVGEVQLPGFGDRCVLRLTEGPTRAPETPQRLEYHKKYVDLQLNRTGSELIAWARPEATTTVTEYDPARDVEFVTTASPVEYFRSSPERFFIFFPTDYHLPSIHDGDPQSVKKLVVKIEYLP
jgi:YhcH/YjgK/YiaL family protein